MKLLIKQSVFLWTDTFDVYDQEGTPRYFVKGEFFSLGHKLHVYDQNGQEIGVIREKLMSFMPVFEIESQGVYMGRVEKKFTFFRPKYELDYKGWRVEGDFMNWEYDVYDQCTSVVHITKEPFHWGDTYVLDFANPEDEQMGLLLVLAIDAANCTHGQ